MEGLFELLEQNLASGSLMAYLTALAAGILTSFTPCVYPVIPITIGYIGANAAGSKWRGFLLSSSYVAGIAMTYSALGAVAALTGRLFGQASTSPVSFFIVANISILLGLSMLGVFELPIPALFDRLRPKGRPGGVLPAILVGIVSGLIVAPCTAPPVFAILTYVATKQNVAFGVTILFTFAVGMGALLIVLGTFTGLIVSLPKAGPWLDRVKKGFGWALILAGEYFLFAAGRMSI